MVRTLDLPARTKSLKYSFGIVASAASIKRAANLRVAAIRPGVFAVGACTCDLWRYSCSCKAARTNAAKGISQQAKPCPHYLALYLSHNWTPTDPDPVLYLKTAGIEQPEILATYARLKEFKGLYRISSSQYGEDRRHVHGVSKDSDPFLQDVPTWQIYKIQPFYE